MQKFPWALIALFSVWIALVFTVAVHAAGIEVPVHSIKPTLVPWTGPHPAGLVLL